MSYCRWSSMDFKCDLYCFAHVAGHYQTYVAGNKIVSPIFPDAPWKLLTKGGRVGMWLWGWWHRLHMFTVSHGIRRDITLPHAGASFEDETLEDFKATLLMLRGLGYKFPDYVLEVIDEEIKERDEAAKEAAESSSTAAARAGSATTASGSSAPCASVSNPFHSKRLL